ncbi:hypothetical protein BDN70DRAFT_126740 [Pholiota conissans]|uniref:Uncharacterized protein n=1 Tax=Pholiota conissans TaxID=109636 RepID=A0A9P5ZCR4_9AGAR|nr:hypothetical protein BDN70DRAFT_126740 [Pholiota conissans]
MSIAPPDESDFEEEHLLTPPSRPSSHPSNASVASRGLKQDQTPSSKNILLSPSTPPSRHTPRTTRSKHQSPSPMKGIPDLPTPSSSDESEHVAWNNAETPRPNVNGASNASWRPTPRPPGGWLQTPMHPRTRSRPNENADEHGTFQKNETDVDRRSLEPKTPVRSANTSSSKTPRLPGAWQNPALVPQSSSLQNLEQNQTPAPSISKESVLDSKTPYVPGGWTTTPAARKSILKVRFNQETEDTLSNEASVPHFLGKDTPSKSFAKKVSPNDTSSAPSSSLRSTRAPQASGIRILDAYGRQQFSDKPVEEFTPSRNGQRFADSIGREAQESGQADGDEQLDKDEDPPSSRTELLSRIRRGLDNLVDDIDEIDRERDVRLNDRARMDQLNALSMQARKNRERLRDEATKFQPTFQCDTIPSEPFDLKFSPSYRRRYAAMIILQLLLILLMYR